MVGLGPADDDDENELRKAWTIEILMNNSDISTNMMNEEESMSDDEKCSYMPGESIQITQYNIICIK